MIRKASFSDIDTILDITKACAKAMIANGIYQWNAHYPTKAPFVRDVERKELYVFEQNATIMGCIVLSTFMDEVYKPVTWLTPNENNLYIHRLAVHPDAQGKGIAQQLMTYAEQFAIDNAYSSIRLDTFSQNKRNQKFYDLRGYKQLEAVYFPKQSEHPFYCYELVL